METTVSLKNQISTLSKWQVNNIEIVTELEIPIISSAFCSGKVSLSKSGVCNICCGSSGVASQ